VAAKFSSAAAARGVTGSRFDPRRLRRRDFDAVYREGAQRSAPGFRVIVRPNGTDRVRFGISVRRSLGGAVVRNRIKRRLREILRRVRPRLAPGWDIVVEPRAPEIARTNFARLEAELTRLLGELAR
jgi:ribonuclease P protein component